jgi:7-cyano-7-deazaguanine reductase
MEQCAVTKSLTGAFRERNRLPHAVHRHGCFQTRLAKKSMSVRRRDRRQAAALQAGQTITFRENEPLGFGLKAILWEQLFVSNCLFSAGCRKAIAPCATIKCPGESMADYTDEHAQAGIKTKLPKLDTWPNQYPGYVITTRYPEYTSVCPKTGLPDYGTIIIEYVPKKLCIELKALKMYLLAYRNLGIFYENAVNKMLEDIVSAIQPEWCVVRGEFTPRGGLNTTIEARWPRKKSFAK